MNKKKLLSEPFSVGPSSLRIFVLQNEAASSDGQESSEEAELKRKKIEVQKVIVGVEEMELAVLKICFMSHEVSYI